MILFCVFFVNLLAVNIEISSVLYSKAIKSIKTFRKRNKILCNNIVACCLAVVLPIMYSDNTVKGLDYQAC